MNAHPAGPKHAEIQLHGTRLPDRARPSAAEHRPHCSPPVWPRNAARGDDGVVRLAGVPVTELAEQYGTPLFVVDEDDFRSRCRDMAAAFGARRASALRVQGVPVRRDRPLGRRRGPVARRRAPAASWPSRCTRIPGRANRAARQQQVGRRAGRRGVAPGSGTSCSTRSSRSTGSTRVAGAAGVVQDVLIRVTVGVEAHTHEFIATAHEDQKFGFSLAGGDADRTRVAPRVRRRQPAAGRPAQPHRLADLRGRRLRARRAPRDRPAARRRRRVRRRQAPRRSRSSISAAAWVSRTCRPTTRRRWTSWPRSCATSSRTESARAGSAGADASRSSPAAPSPDPGTVTLYEVGTIKDVRSDGSATRRYVSVDGGMSDNIRTALYQAEYDCRLVSRRQRRPTPVVARVVGKHCESGDIVIRDTWMPEDVGARRSARRRRHRCILLFDVQPLQPAHPARRGRGA